MNTKTAVSPLDFDIDLNNHRITNVAGATGPNTSLLANETQWTTEFVAGATGSVPDGIPHTEVVYSFPSGAPHTAAHLELDALVTEPGGESTSEFTLHGLFKYNGSAALLLEQSGGGTGTRTGTGTFDGGVFLTDTVQTYAINLGATGPDILLTVQGNASSDMTWRYWASLRKRAF
jgi:hypothetical protein